jgi:hypothetical protein
VSNWTVVFAFERSWPIIASIGVHAGIATGLVMSGVASRSTVDRLSPARDIWIGDTLEVAEPAAARQGPETAAPADAPPATVVAPRSAEPKERPRRAEPAKNDHAETDALDGLAQRILAYEPKHGESEREAQPEASAGATVRGKNGGMQADGAPSRGFAKAFTRALPAANSADPIWNQLPLGRVGWVRVSVTVDENGAIAESRVWDKPRKPPVHLSRLVDRTLLLLNGGRFALTHAGAGTETLSVDVTLSERPVENGPLALGFEAPAPGSPGRAYFQLATGRLVEANVSVDDR